MAKAQPTKKALTKSQLIANLAEATGLTKKDIDAVFNALQEEIRKCLTKGPEVFVLPGLLKIEKRRIPARPARKGVMVMGQLRDIPAKPATTKVRIRALKALKDMVAPPKK
ncbi:MAG: HU family DNA-binding protein [Thermoguttaceae bacterium]|nr:HU family DNA-binding protein [Thermoguttaceae bacterium]MDW8077744.1 HU family DNA-binding protein [Thermoguttaceae bacterium]